MIVTKSVFEKSIYVVAAAFALVLVAISPLAAQPSTTPFELTGVGPTWASLAGVYTSPYTAMIGTETNVPAICDDFAADSYIGEEWTAYLTPLSNVSSGVWNAPITTPDSYLAWGNGSSPIMVGSQFLNQAQAYTVAAVLAVDILTTVGMQQEQYSYALWGLFDPSGAFGQLSSDTADQSAAMSDLTGALSYASNSLNLNQVQTDVNATTIYSYDSATLPTGCGGTCPPPPQEFITVNMAEPPAPALLGMDLLGLAGMILIAHRRGWLVR